MKARFIACAGLAAALIGCGGEADTTLAPPIKNLGAVPPADSASAIDGAGGGGENIFGPKRKDVDQKIAEIRANGAFSEELKKQLIDEVERTYKEAQAGVKGK